MIVCRYEQERNMIELRGHAEYAERGRDIVCAMACCLMYALREQCVRLGGEDLTSFSATFDTGKIRIEYPSDDRLVREAFIQTVGGLKVIGEQYGDFLTVETS